MLSYKWFEISNSNGVVICSNGSHTISFEEIKTTLDPTEKKYKLRKTNSKEAMKRIDKYLLSQ